MIHKSSFNLCTVNPEIFTIHLISLFRVFLNWLNKKVIKFNLAGKKCFDYGVIRNPNLFVSQQQTVQNLCVTCNPRSWFPHNRNIFWCAISSFSLLKKHCVHLGHVFMHNKITTFNLAGQKCFHSWVMTIMRKPNLLVSQQ